MASLYHLQSPIFWTFLWLIKRDNHILFSKLCRDSLVIGQFSIEIPFFNMNRIIVEKLFRNSNMINAVRLSPRQQFHVISRKGLQQSIPADLDGQHRPVKKQLKSPQTHSRLPSAANLSKSGSCYFKSCWNTVVTSWVPMIVPYTSRLPRSVSNSTQRDVNSSAVVCCRTGG